MEFSIKWAGVSVAYIGMMWGAGMVWRMTPAGPFGLYQMFGIGVGMLGGGGAALPFVASNFAAALITVWLTRGQTFVTQFGVFAIIALSLGGVVLAILNQAFRQLGGRLDLPTLVWVLAMEMATFALALLLMKFAPSRGFA